MYEWDLARQIKDQTETASVETLSFNKPDFLRQLHREWNDLPHRQENFESLVLRCLLTSESLQARLLPVIRSFPATLRFGMKNNGRVMNISETPARSASFSRPALIPQITSLRSKRTARFS